MNEKPTEPALLQGITDALAAIAVATARQLPDPAGYADTLEALGRNADAAGHGPSAGLIWLLASEVRRQVMPG